MKLQNILRNKEVNNASWLIAGRVTQMLLSLLVGVWSARFLGPSGYGTISYANSYIAFFMAFCTLGINSVIIKEFNDQPEKTGELLGTALVMRLISSVLSALTIIAIVCVVDLDEPKTIAVVALSSVSLLFHIVDTFRYWFQYHYRSKVTAIATLAAYVISSAYRLSLLITKQDLLWFALSSSADYITLGVILYASYRYYHGPALRVCIKTAKRLIGKSYHYILSGMMVSIYGQTDKLMLKQMVDDASVGYYTTAAAVSSMWTFVLSAIIDAVYPTIMRLHKTDYVGYEKKNRQLYAIVFYVSILASLCFMVAGKLVIAILYGAQYSAAVPILKIVTWYTAFTYLGVARNAWIVCENKQKYLKYIYVLAVVVNVGLNALMIPYWGASGAAMASLLTQLSTSIVLPLLLKPLRPNARMMIDAIMLKGVL